MSTSQIVSISIQASYELNGVSAEEVRKGLENDIRTALTSGILSARLPGPMLHGFDVKAGFGVKSNVQPSRPQWADLGMVVLAFRDLIACAELNQDDMEEGTRYVLEIAQARLFELEEMMGMCPSANEPQDEPTDPAPGG